MEACCARTSTLLEISPALKHDQKACVRASAPYISTRDALGLQKKIDQVMAALGSSMFLTTRSQNRCRDEQECRIGVLFS